METKDYMELVELIEGQRAINSRQSEIITELLNRCAEQENFINSLLIEGYCDN
jgi:hypothetical protein